MINEVKQSLGFVVQKVCNRHELVRQNFTKCIRGYHLTNGSPINETIWEDVNATIFTHSEIEVYNQSNGSHISGMDIACAWGNISNKSAKYYNHKKQHIKISSYRLSSICNMKHCGVPTDFIKEINKRKNFNYYSILVRDEKDDSIDYDWLFIPANHPLLDPASYHWVPTMGKTKKTSGQQLGWNTNVIKGCKMSITFSMSSQLWLHIEMTEELKKYIIASTRVLNKPKFDYISLFQQLSV